MALLGLAGGALAMWLAAAGPLGPVSRTAPPRDDAEARARVAMYLDSREAVRAEDWRALGPAGATALEEIAQDPKKLPTRRARALAALALVGAPHAPELAVELARRENEPAVVRMSAVRAAGTLLDQAGLMATMKPLLEGAKNSRVRATAAEVLAGRIPRVGCASVRAQSAREKTDARPAFEHALRACAKSGAVAPPGQ
jgi:HEAT repeat protein